MRVKNFEYLFFNRIYSRCLSLILVSILSMFSSVSVFSHELGLVAVKFSQKNSSTYQIDITDKHTSFSSFQPPILPPQCQLTRQDSRVRFIYQCQSYLMPQDEVKFLWPVDSILFEASWLNGTKSRKLLHNANGTIAVELSQLLVPSESSFNAFQHYFYLGIEHILEGVDHLAFVLCLLFIVKSKVSLVKTITAFTLGHSISLAWITIFSVEPLGRVVEAGIALSIVVLCVEILTKQYSKSYNTLTFRSTWVIAALFGLLHGFGFAGALAEMGLPKSELLIGLFAFNLGVEVGQLVFVTVVICIVKLRKELPPIFVARGTELITYSIGTIACYWFIERAFPIFMG